MPVPHQTSRTRSAHDAAVISSSAERRSGPGTNRRICNCQLSDNQAAQSRLDRTPPHRWLSPRPWKFRRGHIEFGQTQQLVGTEFLETQAVDVTSSGRDQSPGLRHSHSFHQMLGRVPRDVRRPNKDSIFRNKHFCVQVADRKDPGAPAPYQRSELIGARLPALHGILACVHNQRAAELRRQSPRSALTDERNSGKGCFRIVPNRRGDRRPYIRGQQLQRPLLP